MSILLLCGYRGSGKDHFCRTYQEGKLQTWLIYGATPIVRQDNVQRLSHADRMKELCHEEYGLYQVTEADKERPLPPGCYPPGVVTLRDLYIWYSNKHKENDINHWCKQVFIDHTQHYILTDFRFQHEWDFVQQQYYDMDLSTLRVYRSCVVEPPLSVDTEHDLDEVKTLYLAVTSEAEFKLAVERFPQYRDYTLQGMI